MGALQAHTRIGARPKSHYRVVRTNGSQRSVHAASKRHVAGHPGLPQHCSRLPSSSCRDVLCRYRPDKPEDAVDTKAPQPSATEAAVYSELVADAAAQAAADELSTATSTPESSWEGAEAAAVAAGSAGALTASPPPAAETRSGHNAKDHKHHHGHHHHSSSKQQKPASDLTPAQKLQARLEDMTSKYESLDGRLDSLENTLVELLKNVKARSRTPAAAAEVGPGAAAAAADGGGYGALAEGATDADLPDLPLDDDDDDEGGGLFDLKKLQTSLSENINKGYLESVKHLREMLMAYEWHLHGKELAERRGVAAFEKHCAEHDVEIDFDVLSQLYSNPNDMSVLPNNKLKMLARSIIQQAVDDRYCSIYFECTNTAKELAKTGLKDIIPDSAGKVGGVIKDILPVPGFLKK